MSPLHPPGEETFPSELRSVRAARRFVRQSLTATQWAKRVPDIELATSEMSTNAIEHGEGSSFSVTVGMWDDRIEVAVRSSGSIRTPAIQPSNPQNLTGRGLRIVSTIADDFRIEQTLEHVTVRCTFVQHNSFGRNLVEPSLQATDRQLPPPIPAEPNTR